MNYIYLLLSRSNLFEKFDLPQLFFVAGIFTPIIAGLRYYFVPDLAFVLMLFAIVVVDTLSGMYAAYKNNVFNSKKMGAVLPKIIIYITSLGLVHALSVYLSDTKDQNEILLKVFEFLGIGTFLLDNFLFFFIFLKEFISFAENCYKLGVPILPKWVLNKFIVYYETGEKSNERKNND